MTSHNTMVNYIPELEKIRKAGPPELKRYTDDEGHKLPTVSHEEICKQLAEYEKTGISPEVVQLLKRMWFDPVV